MNAESRMRAEKAIVLARSVTSLNSADAVPTPVSLAVALEEQAREVIRLQHVVDRIVTMYTKVDEPLADYLNETGDL